MHKAWIGGMVGMVVAGMPAIALAPVPPARDVLSEDQARLRAARVSQVRYDLTFRIGAERTDYSGEARIRFRWHPSREPLILDYTGKQVKAVKLNGRTIPAVYSGTSLTLPAASLKADNDLLVQFVADYDTTGDGFQRFVDPVDQRVYLYTNFEPYGAHRLFPCFDQPDLKGTFETWVDAPADWHVIGNGLQSRQQLAGGRQRVHLAKTPPISTYLYALHAGPYAVWQKKDAKIPMAIYARQSLATFVEADDIFAITEQGLNYFAHYFATPYPFQKYDHVFAPELNAGAMENPGAVTMNEYMIFRHPVTDQAYFDRDETILHEMAHMWFGDLVTMRWWNDLWLNESFATYMAALAKAALPRYGDAWRHFHEAKLWAYDTDEKVTTHPIEAPIPDTEAAFQNFDGITYGKGASVIKQLAFFIGQDAFRDGVRRYFLQHAWANATLADFVGALQGQTREDLSQWTRQWLQTAGVNTLTPGWSCQDGRLQTIRLTQGVASGDGLMRSHRAEIGLFGPDGTGKWVLQKRVPVSYHGAETTVPLQAACPDLVMANVGDHDYVKVALDAVSLKAAEQHLSQVEDPLVRQQLWGSLWSMVKDQQLPVPRFLSLLEQQLPVEKDLVVVERQLNRLQEAVLTFLAPPERYVWLPRMEAFLWRNLAGQASGSDGQIIWADAYLSVARSASELERLLGLLEGQIRVPGLEVHQDMRWNIVQRLVSQKHAAADRLLKAEQARDPSDRGKKAYLAAIALRPTAEAKTEAWQRIVSDQSLSLSELEAVMAGFQGDGQDDLVRPYVSRYFGLLPKLYAERDLAYASSFARSLFPDLVEPEVLKAAELFLQQDLPRPLRKIVLERHQALERILKIRQAARMAAP